MRYLMLYHPDPSATPHPNIETEMGRFIEESIAKGTLLSTGGIRGGSAGTRVRHANGKVTVTDGPFAEAKELVGGFALCELPSKEAAIEYARRFLALVGGGESEIHQLDG